VSSKKLIIVHTIIIRRAVPAVRKENMHKRPDNKSTARGMPQSRINLKFNLRRDNRVARKQPQLNSQRTSDKYFGKPI
jgi:hypothetical protein